MVDFDKPVEVCGQAQRAANLFCKELGSEHSRFCRSRVSVQTTVGP